MLFCCRSCRRSNEGSCPAGCTAPSCSATTPTCSPSICRPAPCGGRLRQHAAAAGIGGTSCNWELWKGSLRLGQLLAAAKVQFHEWRAHAAAGFIWLLLRRWSQHEVRMGGKRIRKGLQMGFQGMAPCRVLSDRGTWATLVGAASGAFASCSLAAPVSRLRSPVTP